MYDGGDIVVYGHDSALEIGILGFTDTLCNLHTYLGPTQVKCRLVISDIFYVMNFRHFLEMLEFDLWHFSKMSEIHCIRNARN